MEVEVVHLRTHDNPHIRVIDWARLGLACLAVIWMAFGVLQRVQNLDVPLLNVVMSNLFALWVLLTGLRHLILDKQKLLGMFYVFFALFMLISVNFVATQF